MLRTLTIHTRPVREAGRRWGILNDVNSANIAAGVTAGLFYAFGAAPVHLRALADLQIDVHAASSWFFISFVTAAISSLVLSMAFRMPVPIGWSLPGLIFLATSGAGYSHAELVGASLVAGLMIVLLGLAGIGERLMRWVPLPIVMGMFAGNVLGYVTAIFRQFEIHPALVGATILGYLGGKALNRAWFPPLLAAVAGGIAVAAVTGGLQMSDFAWTAPSVEMARPRFDLGSILTLSVPLVVMAIGIGAVQGIGVLRSQGYRPPVRLLITWIGAATLINGAFGGHPSSIQNNGVALLGGADAGPRDQRYVGSVLASLVALGIGFSAATAGAVVGILPPGLVSAVAGLALLTSLADALRKTVMTDLSMGALFALVIAASGVTLLGIGAAFWALVGGLAVSFALERSPLRASWQAA